jgi:trans-aconitate methyltransferase
LTRSTESPPDHEAPADGEFADLTVRFDGRDDEPITGAAADQFEREALAHPERYRLLQGLFETAVDQSPLVEIVDAGAGPGLLSERLTRRWLGANVTAVDLSPDMVRLARARSAGTFNVLEGDVRRLREIAQRPPDAIVSRRMIHRVDDLHDVLGRMVDGLRPGGVLVNYSFRRPNSAGDRAVFLEAARVRSQEEDLHAAFVRAVLNAPTLGEYVQALQTVAAKVDLRQAKVLVYPFDVAFLLQRS